MARYWDKLTVLVGLLAYLAKTTEPAEILCITNSVYIRSKEFFHICQDLERIQLADIIESFLLTCGDGSPFQRLSTHLRIFLLPPTLGPLVRVLMSLPQELIWLDIEEGSSPSKKFKSLVEDFTEEHWNWWPLRPRVQNLEEDQMSLHWLCLSAKIISRD
ncbi:hypothetical protein BKA65DRAFT_506074 [Rhexocercosporidium sp. MPI-PUGE-AT-0058]|nr:hypothetical protein BKA65DRAFT_506074 [Rhexocercosporidium sp. MPI-PUGE-AT-0058]